MAFKIFGHELHIEDWTYYCKLELTSEKSIGVKGFAKCHHDDEKGSEQPLKVPIGDIGMDIIILPTGAFMLGDPSKKLEVDLPYDMDLNHFKLYMEFPEDKFVDDSRWKAVKEVKTFLNRLIG